MQHKRKGSEMLIKFQSENMKKKDHLQDLGIDRRIILKGTVKKKNGWQGGGLDSFHSEQGPVAGSCKQYTGPTSPIKCDKFLDYQNNF
jgi:hypothetical protein